MQEKNERTLRVKTPSGELETVIDLNICKNLLDLQKHCTGLITESSTESRSIFSASVDSHSIRLLGNNGQDLIRCYGESFFLEDLELGFDVRISADEDAIIVCEISKKHAPTENTSLQLK